MQPIHGKRPPSLRRASLLALALGSAAMTLAFSSVFCPFADNVTDFHPGPLSTSSTAASIGAPSGEGLSGGSSDTLTLGVGGTVTLHLSSIGYDGPGTDLIVCENPFYVTGTNGLFAELMFVEVSSDGSHFVRFPTSYTGPTGPFLPTFGAPAAWYRGFAGVLPVTGNPALGIPALDVVACGGDAFDYADLANEPAVLAGAVDLQDIEYVRLVDIPSGTLQDSAGHTVWDCGLDVLASADVDAIVAVNSACVASGERPRVEMTLVNGFITIRIEDNDTFADVKHGLTASVNGLPIPFTSLLPFFVVTQIDQLGVTLVTGPVPTGAFPLTLKVSARDDSGLFGGDALTLP